MRIQIKKEGIYKLVYFELPTYGVDPVGIAAKIDAMAESWNGPETVLFRGQGPVWLYGMLVHSAHATPNCATFEPRKNGYVVVHRHGGELHPGEVITSSVVGMTVVNGKIVGGEDAALKRNIVVSVGGPPHSGKSVLLAELYRQLLDRMPSEVFLQRGCPDGEGMWSAESEPSLVKTIRQKGQFGKQFTDWITSALQGLSRGFKITLVDLGGKRLPPNDDILRGSTHCIVLSSQEDETTAWVEYVENFGCEILATIDSRLVTSESGELDGSARSMLDSSATPIRGTLVNLDRAAPANPYREAVKVIVDRLISEAE